MIYYTNGDLICSFEIILSGLQFYQK